MSEAAEAGGFVRLDNRIITDYAPRIGSDALAVYLVLALHAGVKTRKCYPSTRTISRLVKLSRPTVLKAICKLEEERLIKVERERTARGDREVNLYTLLPITSGQPASPPVVNDIDHRGKGALPEQDLINKTQENKGVSAQRVAGLPARTRAGSPPTPDQPAEEHPGDPNLDHLAVKAYQEICERTPSAIQAAEIARVVTDVATWQAVLRDWLLANYMKHNVPGMLDKYRKAIAERNSGNGKVTGSGRSGFQGNRVYDRRESRPPETPEEAARRDAEWDMLRQSRSRSGNGEAG